METIQSALSQYGVLGIFSVILLYFARDVLKTLKTFLLEAKEDKKTEMAAYKELAAELRTEIKSLNETHRVHLVTTQYQFYEVINENSKAYEKIGESQLKIAEANAAVAVAINHQAQMLKNLDCIQKNKKDEERRSRRTGRQAKETGRDLL